MLVLTGVVVVTGLVIAWFKDLPDVEGDRRHGIGTLTLRLGPRAVVALGTAVLALGYTAVAAAAAAGLLAGLDAGVLGVGHVLMAVGLVAAARRVDLDDRAAVGRFYQGIWLLFYTEYALFAAAAVLA